MCAINFNKQIFWYTHARPTTIIFHTVGVPHGGDIVVHKITINDRWQAIAGSLYLHESSWKKKKKFNTREKMIIIITRVVRVYYYYG